MGPLFLPSSPLSPPSPTLFSSLLPQPSLFPPYQPSSSSSSSHPGPLLSPYPLSSPLVSLIVYPLAGSLRLSPSPYSLISSHVSPAPALPSLTSSSYTPLIPSFSSSSTSLFLLLLLYFSPRLVLNFLLLLHFHLLNFSSLPLLLFFLLLLLLLLFLLFPLLLLHISPLSNIYFLHQPQAPLPPSPTPDHFYTLLLSTSTLF
ncbi:hypothetical protein Pcinc_012557 [Petrolisthes cinctipes]|uniref:Uncharacterized protein n=1 Tax=Petrolisthes cinctipes TaxID=88211 RepID=A0AAE1KTC3_PETCI|nr:hypothetical protein Pcinc_012557 [Petrolisthes cinctipes]